MAGKKNASKTEITIEAVKTYEVGVFIRGTRPFLFNRLSEKAKRELFFPSGRKNEAEKASTLKHAPYEEYRDSVYRSIGNDNPTRLIMPGGSFRKAIAAAALDIPGSSKAQIGRLVRVKDYNVSIFGVPKISSMIVRMADAKRTPDVRIRAILPEWACQLTLVFSSLIKEPTVINLLAAAGEWIGVGDGRNEKGSSLSCGCFEIVSCDDPDWNRIVKTGGLAQQDAALLDPEFYDLETEELLGWFDTEMVRREGTVRAIRNGKHQKEEVAS